MSLGFKKILMLRNSRSISCEENKTHMNNINVITGNNKTGVSLLSIKIQSMANIMLHSCKLCIDYYTKYKSDLCE